MKNNNNTHLKKSLLWVQDNEFLHFRRFLGPDHLVQFSAWLPFAPYLSSLEILLGFSEFNLLPSLLGLNLAQLMFKVSLPENALCWGLLYMFFPFKIMDVLQVEKFQGHLFHPILVTSFSVVFGDKVTKILCNSLLIFQFVLPILSCKQKTSYRKSRNLSDE